MGRVDVCFVPFKKKAVHHLQYSDSSGDKRLVSFLEEPRSVCHFVPRESVGVDGDRIVIVKYGVRCK